MTDYDPNSIESRWHDRWTETERYQADPTDDESTFITVPYPYPSGGMHIGHARTYTVPDVYARYRRLQGDAVLFPIGWHVTGTPIIGAVERLKKGEEEQLDVLQNTYNVPSDTLSELETPMGFARYFIEEHYKTNMKALGLSVDWRREFTTNDERYKRFITWQYERLNDRELLEKGLHPVKYDLEQENAVTTHDILEGEEAEFQEYTLVKFEWDGTTVPMATLRPETIHGVTNTYIDPDAEYVRAAVDDEEWIVSADGAEKLDHQARDVEILDSFTGDSLVGEQVTNPVTEESVPVLPAGFVDPDNATGVVMSVPAHSPDDWIALQAAKADAERLREHGIDPQTVQAIDARPIANVEGYGEIPARDAVEFAEVESTTDPELETVRQELYNNEFHGGRLKEMYGEYAGEIISDVRDEIKQEYQQRGAFDAMYDFAETVISRAGGKVIVAEQETWFLRYNDTDWTEKAHEAVESMTAIPETTREQYTHTIDWLEEWPCIRNYGLGTPLPMDEDFIIEPLSDSTIYMSYYTIAHRLQDIPVEQLTPAFFDTLFYGADAVEEPDETALELHEEWEYWYPVDFRCSGNDLISNHLTFYLYHHAELFEEPQWPQGITSMGMGLLEGKKMSSSKGHVVLPSEAIEEYGADTVRFFLLNSAEPWQDFDWRADRVEDTRDQLERFYSRATELIERDVPDEQPSLEPIDRWLLVKLQATIEATTDALEAFETRKASQAAFYGFEEHLRWYRRRTDRDRAGARWTLQEVLRTRLELLAPFVPFLTNELHEQLIGEPATGWPSVDPAFIDQTVEIEESLVEQLTEDINDIVDVTGTDPDRIAVYTAADWKRDVFEQVTETGPDVGAVMSEVMEQPELRERGDEVNQLVGDLVEDVRGRDDETLSTMTEIEEQTVYEQAEEFFAQEFDAEIVVKNEADAEDDEQEQADDAVPFRPAVHLD
ncbi:leucine--tRNA ligase [Halocatena pleomorpha]|uniref:Leucine--tRNA ligase n=1 Tax=Halocatena pleomorpha TaxID=1785090 RepID=A0A3P3R4B4_9EURY|nr:leucine--tRNA ligase [Halocatena pleomorpha]RRJ28331.1 leucine--tRNA ligase [Halocatena pleomorpha]